LLVGKIIDNRYKVVSMLGKGVNGTVYQALDQELNYDVALKVLSSSDDHTLERFRHGAESAHGLAHPNVVRVYSFNKSPEGFAYLVMDCVQGRNLAEILAADSKLSEERCIQIFTQLCDAIEHAHGKGVVHRNLKPSNILLVETPGENDLVKVLDFGLSKTVGEKETMQKLAKKGQPLGNADYMSPEQCSGGNLDGRSDIYAIGAIMFQCLTGRKPFAGANVFEIMARQVSEPVPQVTAVAPELKYAEQLTAVINRALAKKRDERYQSAGEMRHDLSLLPQVSPEEWKTRSVANRPPEHFKPKAAAPARAYAFDWKPVIVAVVIVLTPMVALVAVALLDLQVPQLTTLKLAVQEKILPADDPRLINTLNYLSEKYKSEGRYAEAYKFKDQITRATAKPEDINADADNLRQKYH
jgi:serine/threonine protein kinase